MSAVQAAHSVRIAVLPEVYAEVVEPGSWAFEEARRIQEERFASIITSGIKEGAVYVKTTDVAPRRTLTIAIRRTSRPNGPPSDRDPVLGAARLELAGAMFLQSVVRLRPASYSAAMLSGARVAEIGGLAIDPGLDKISMLDALDALAVELVHLAGLYGVEWLWLFPRNGLMNLMRAEIPGILPPFRFTYCSDVAGWNEGNPRLEQFLAMRPKGLRDFPHIYQISSAILAEDFLRRLARREERQRQRDEMDGLLFRAMRDARRLAIHDERTRGAYLGA